MSCGSRQISAATLAISAPQVSCIDEEIHNVVHPKKGLEMVEAKNRTRKREAEIKRKSKKCMELWQND